MSKQHEIVVVAGLSGVGKSHLINELKKSDSQFVHFSAGSLIKKGRNLSDRDELRLLGENEILQNQYLLVDQLKEELESLSDRNIVLFDAHMVIDSDESILEIPFEIFERLNPSRLILLCCEPEMILSRREKDGSRLRPIRSRV
ncbi:MULTISPECIES: ATP-binding protein [unclassified Ketobacter]|uniref:ATP-binding protein n=1 Tax=unclassified Ketobacter TaxID=2639109 RepID=UPI000F25E666|nr:MULTISPECIES: ATP-binding protein [unclassified Ketobacter]RLT87429.1 MAG: AAA family ATPase [Ketobacter sp. GenoA1]RLT94245.1 MAG: AAA family ATPase [Ketobacter sp.]